MRLPFAATFLILLPATLLAQGSDPREPMPERPTVATHAYTVAPRIVEIESGLELDRFDDGSRVATWSNVIKLGLTSHTQLNLGIPAVGPAASDLGAGDVSVGVKWRLLEHHPLLGSFAMLPAIKFSSATATRGTGTTDGTLTAISSRNLGPVSVDLNVAWTMRSGDGSSAPKQALLWTASFGGPAYRSLGWVFEWFGYPATSGPAGTPAWSALLFGPTLKVMRTLVIDAGMVKPLAGPQRDGLYAGLTWNVTRL
jgi:hypothetical protein